MLTDRRAVLAGFPSAPALPASLLGPAFGQSGEPQLALTPACADGHKSTPTRYEGPFFKRAHP